jgi:hypothetical protein
MTIQFSTKASSFVLLGALLLIPGKPACAEFEPAKGWSGHLFPSYIVATATMKAPDPEDDDSDSEVEVLGDQRGLLGVTLEADEDDQEVTVTISCDAIMEPSEITCTLSEAGETYLVNPKIKYKYDKLIKHTQTGPITVTYKVEIGDEVEEQTEVLTLRTINDCPFSVVKDGVWTSIRFMFTAYVNEQHPFVDKILREALDTGIVDSFSGYQAKESTEVYRQAYALWHVMSNRDVRYSSVTKSAAISDTVGSQHIRLLDESINNGQANCVDGSALFASLLRKINIEPMLVHVPGHCYLAFYLDAEGKELTALETTMIGSLIEGEALKVGGLEDVVDEEAQAENSWKTFAAAIAHGTAHLKKHEKEFRDPKNGDYSMISISAARKAGILPIGFKSNQKLIEAPQAEEEDEKE